MTLDSLKVLNFIYLTLIEIKDTSYGSLSKISPAGTDRGISEVLLEGVGGDQEYQE